MEDAYKAIRGIDSKKAEEYRAQAMESEREIEERFKADEPKNTAAVSKGLEGLRRHIRGLEQELESLSPAERTAPAHYVGDITHRPSGLGDAGAASAREVVETNREFFDPTTPVTSFQLFAVYGLTGAEDG